MALIADEVGYGWRSASPLGFAATKGRKNGCPSGRLRLIVPRLGTWYTPQDITYSNGNYYHRRYTFRSDNTFTFEGQTTKSTSKPSSWEVEVNSTYSILNYEVKGECVKVYIKIPSNDGVWYKGLIERWPHFIFFAYENTDGSLTHGVYMEPE